MIRRRILLRLYATISPRSLLISSHLLGVFPFFFGLVMVASVCLWAAAHHATAISPNELSSVCHHSGRKDRRGKKREEKKEN
jgi:hypothetical protein